MDRAPATRQAPEGGAARTIEWGTRVEQAVEAGSKRERARAHYGGRWGGQLRRCGTSQPDRETETERCNQLPGISNALAVSRPPALPPSLFSCYPSRLLCCALRCVQESPSLRHACCSPLLIACLPVPPATSPAAAPSPSPPRPHRLLREEGQEEKEEERRKRRRRLQGDAPAQRIRCSLQ